MSTEERTEEQKMLERPVRGYQLRELTKEMADLRSDVVAGFQDLKNGIAGVATVEYVNEMVAKTEKNLNDKIDEEVKKIHLKYNPTYQGIWWVVGAMAAGLIAIAVTSIWG